MKLNDQKAQITTGFQSIASAGKYFTVEVIFVSPLPPVFSSGCPPAHSAIELGRPSKAPLAYCFRRLIMALRISLSPSASLRGSSHHSSPAVAAWCPHHRLPPADSGRRTAAMMLKDSRRGIRVSPVRSSLEMVEPTVGQVTEVNKDTFWPIVKAAAPKIVVLDMYTQWCGPCKVIAPKFKELSEKYLDVVFLKLDCNQDNRPLAKELGIKVVPTFKVLKDSKIVKEVTGAKLDDLVLAIETAKSSQ